VVVGFDVGSVAAVFSTCGAIVGPGEP